MNELVAVLIGGLLAISGSIVGIWLSEELSYRRKRNCTADLVRAELIAAQELSDRFIQGTTEEKALKNATPLWKSLPGEVMYLSRVQAVEARRALTLYFELSACPSKTKASECSNACAVALKHFA